MAEEALDEGPEPWHGTWVARARDRRVPHRTGGATGGASRCAIGSVTGPVSEIPAISSSRSVDSLGTIPSRSRSRPSSRSVGNGDVDPVSGVALVERHLRRPHQSRRLARRGRVRHARAEPEHRVPERRVGDDVGDTDPGNLEQGAGRGSGVIDRKAAPNTPPMEVP